jgi:hypothetical protein
MRNWKMQTDSISSTNGSFSSGKKAKVKFLVFNSLNDKLVASFDSPILRLLLRVYFVCSAC